MSYVRATNYVQIINRKVEDRIDRKILDYCPRLTCAIFATKSSDDVVSDKAVPANKVCGLYEVEEEKGEQ